MRKVFIEIIILFLMDDAIDFSSSKKSILYKNNSFLLLLNELFLFPFSVISFNKVIRSFRNFSFLYFNKQVKKDLKWKDYLKLSFNGIRNHEYLFILIPNFFY
jgi:hypothetical protein